jgi:carboxypeptidase T
MAETMAAWNGYEPMQAADLYVASGDTVDWAFGQEGIVGFTFELDPQNTFMTQIDPKSGFYPGQGIIQQVFNKNLQPALYLIDMADNPYRAVNTTSQNLGLHSALF